jgi:hypothetical protein
LTDDKAKMLVDEALSIEAAEAKLKTATAAKLYKVTPAKKDAHCLQFENKVRAFI